MTNLTTSVVIKAVWKSAKNTKTMAEKLITAKITTLDKRPKIKAGKVPYPGIIIAAACLTGLIMLLHLPAAPIVHTPESVPDREGNLRFSGVETHPDGYKFAWAINDSAILYPNIPRYAPLYLTLRLNLQRPANVPEALVEVYERPAQPSETDAIVEGTEQKIGELRYNPAAPGPQDYKLTIPVRTYGKGLYLSFKTNSFQVGSDKRQLAFLFIRSELEMKPSHLRYLVWPNLYFPAVFVILLGALAWGWYVGLGWSANIALTAQLAYVLMMAAQSTWRISWLLVVAGVGICSVFLLTRWINNGAQLTDHWRSLLPLLAVCALLIGLFLATNDELAGDTLYYINWSRAIQQYGVWDIYAHEKSLNYLPLVVYLLWLYNLIAVPLGLWDSVLFWRIFASALYLGLLMVLYGLAKAKPGNGLPLPATLLLIGFNVSIFYNPTVWGQSDIIAMLPLALTFYFIYKKQPYAAGILIGLTLISKPQAWFVLPLAVLLMPKMFGWRKALLALVPGGLLALALALPAFGMNGESLVRYWSQGQLAGEAGAVGFAAAYNLSFLVLDFGEIYPRWLTLLGFGLTGLVFAGVLGRTFFDKNREVIEPENSLPAAGILNLACFTFLIKMKERYLVYAMPLFGLAVHYERKWLAPFLAISWLQLLNLSSVLFMNGRTRLQTLPEFFYWWVILLNQSWLRKSIALAFIATLGWLVYLYFAPFIKTQFKKLAK